MSSASRTGSYSGTSSAPTLIRIRWVHPATAAAISSREGNQPVSAR